MTGDDELEDGRERETDEIRIGVDVGGTFTDITLSTAGGDLVTAKVPTTADQSEGVLVGIETACDRAGVDPASITAFTHATTVSVNALLERAGAKTALVTTAGFRDVLEIGRQDRPALYDLEAERPEPLIPRRRRFEVGERATHEGIERPVTNEDIDAVATEIEACDAESVAIAFLHSYATPANEARLADGLRERLEVPVSASHEVLAEFREYERTSTTAVDAFVRPTIDDYVGRLAERAREAGVPAPRIMQSNGGIADAETVREHAATTVLSGPAAGVVGANRTAVAAANRTLEGLVTFDMGGTSSDVSLVRDGRIERTTETEIDGHPIRLPMVDLHTVGSGGGSIARVDAGGALRVGPQSAGADPGPACYGHGGIDPTVTDANVVLGYIGPDAALGGELELEPAAATAALETLADEAGLDSALEAADGVYRVANATMVRAIRSVTVERGYDPRDFGLVAFGGAGPLHAAALAERLEIDTVVVPLPSGVLSAFGLLAADEQFDAARTHRVALADADPEAIGARYDELADEALAGVHEPEAATLEFAADLRYAGQSFELDVDVPVFVSGDDATDDRFDPQTLRERFHEAHERAYGYRTEEPIEFVTLRVTAVVERDVDEIRYEPDDGDPQVGTRETRFDGTFYETPIYDRPSIPVGTTIDGPAVLEQRESTTVVPPGWSGNVREDGTVVLESLSGSGSDSDSDSDPGLDSTPDGGERR
ncbi:hydantoinase/oxoprolinase family protein [Halobacteria archaeon AArc-m2/3/4]|uniref:Hydantoinase/oxoprolinase family protein n=1 Tax=Natronoglomus mannanivorans TaxID=2979990 RepID=A0ABT2QKU0_9EURY|nr:hydantoinase/oxoprolinase family protein [Halobacteria archaeon AArc-m2/3/4]